MITLKLNKLNKTITVFKYVNYDKLMKYKVFSGLDCKKIENFIILLDNFLKYND